MDTLFGLFGDNGVPLPGDRGNGNGDDYKRQIESQLSRLMKNKIPIEQLTNYRRKNDKIVSGLNEIVNIIDESKQHFGEFQKKINILKQTSNSGDKTVREIDRLLGQQERVGELCVEQNRKIQECESEKQRLQRELSSKLEDVGKKDGEIRRLTKQLEDLQKTQTSNVSSITSANEELIKYNQSLVDKIKRIADSQSEIINELDSDLGQGTEITSRIESIKEKLIGLVDSIDDENNRMGPPQVFRNGIQQQQPFISLEPTRIGQPLANPVERQTDVLIQQSRAGPYRAPQMLQSRGRDGFLGGKHKKSRKLSKKGGKRKNMKLLKSRRKK